MRTYGLQDQGYDTVDANIALGFRDDERDYAVAAHMLDTRDLGGLAPIEGLTLSEGLGALSSARAAVECGQIGYVAVIASLP
jgi:hypothetical protein